jgi:hypothetical protein
MPIFDCSVLVHRDNGTTMTKYPAHDRHCFYKYTSASTAVKILESSQVIYRSPIQFNDPFDVQSGLHFEFDIETLPDKILDQVEYLVGSDTRPDVSQTDPFGHAILLMWEKKATHGFPRERMRALLRPQLILLKEQAVDLATQYQNKWWNDFLPRLRVFSVSEDNCNLLMWSHYAQDHTGVVFEFRVLPEQDNALCIAKPIRYRKTPPSLFTEKELLDGIGGKITEPNEALFQYAIIKSDIWAYEKEWRVWDLCPMVQPSLWSYYPVLPDEIGAVYLGCRIDSGMKAEIVRLLSNYPKARIYRATKAVDEYKINFNVL